MRVADLLVEATALLGERPDLRDPRREASWLLAAALEAPEIRLRTDPDAEVSAVVERRFLAWIERRAAGEPAEHLIGGCRFWGRFFRVSPAVLIPRPETELLVEAALDLHLPCRAAVLDVGAGSGCLATTLALERPQWKVTAVERSTAALAVARHNGRDLGADIGWILGDLMTAVSGPFDLIVANLPYLPTAWLGSLSAEVRREPALALDGGEDGLDLVARMISGLPAVLASGGWCLLELAEDQAEVVEEKAAKCGLMPVGRRRDVGGCDRIVVLRARSEGQDRTEVC